MGKLLLDPNLEEGKCRELTAEELRLVSTRDKSTEWNNRMGCLICERIEQIQKGCNPYFVAELETGYVVLGDHQRFAGYTLFLCKEHETELHLLPWDYRMKFCRRCLW